MRKLRTWAYIAIAAQVLSTGLAWVVNGDVISSIVTAVLIPLSFGALGMATRELILAPTAQSLVRFGSIMIFLLSGAAVILAIFSNNPNLAIQSSAAVEAIVVAGIVSSLLIVTISYALWRAQRISLAIAAIGILAAVGVIASNIDSINLMVIAVSRAFMILFLVLLAQSLEPEVATTA